MLKHLSSSAAATLAVLGFTAVGGIVSARYLLPAGKGELTAVILWPTLLVNLGGLGLAEAVTYFSATDNGRSKQVLSAALALSGAALAVLLPVAYLLLPLLLSHYGPRTVQTARWFLLYTPVSLAAVLMMAVLQGNMRFGAYNTLRTMVQIVTVVGMLTAVAAGRPTVGAFALATFAGNLVTLVVAAALVAKAGWLGWTLSPAARPLIGYGLKSQLGSLASMLNMRLDQMLMSALMTAPVLGIYVVAVTIAGAATLAPAAIAIVAAPRISRERDMEGKVRAWGRLLRMSFLLQLGLATALWIAAPYFVQLFFGVSFVPSAPLARILIVASLPLGVNMLMAIGFRACNRPLTPSSAELVSLGATIVSLTMLLPKFGPAGAAWASLAAYSITSLFLFNRAKAQLGVSFRDLLAPRRRDWVDARALVWRREPEGV